ncbi:CheR family methyltransferase [Candidatus Protochlamydia phocaeensis]|uniref:CheR family methyltransferase n=1 Tax=Candidatus Protochlamydia phocaeensis TaxID=1414722 RepID=UPI0008380D99|nr:protein-glutamate O-methyltransferase CheR [Candidatus Protochlamydia phocaeensis]
MLTKKSMDIPEEIYERLIQHLNKEIGLYFSKRNKKDLEKKLQLAVKEFGFEDPLACIEWLLRSPLHKEQIDILARYLTIGETYFFRDPHFFALLENKILPGIIQAHQKTDKTIRIWSAACATGEEPYSIAILLHRLIPKIEDWNIHIIATDINTGFLIKAQRAHYTSWSFRSTPPPIIKNYFVENKKDEFALIPAIRSLVKFSFFNLMNFPYHEMHRELNHFDLIVCHNVLIYFSPAQVKKIIHSLVQSLADGGWLSVSSVEVPFVEDPYLKAISHQNVTIFKKTLSKDPLLAATPALPAIPPPSKPSSLSPPAFKAPPQQPNKREEFYETCLSLYQAGKYEETTRLLNQLLTPYLQQSQILKDKIKEIKLLIRAYANQGRLDLAQVWCEKGLLVNKFDPLLHYAYATILQEKGNLEKALQALKTALYLDPDLIAAHFLAGIILIRQQDRETANVYLRNVLKLLSHRPAEEIVPGTEDMSAARLTEIVKELVKESVNE